MSQVIFHLWIDGCINLLELGKSQVTVDLLGWIREAFDALQELTDTAEMLDVVITWHWRELAWLEWCYVFPFTETGHGAVGRKGYCNCQHSICRYSLGVIRAYVTSGGGKFSIGNLYLAVEIIEDTEYLLPFHGKIMEGRGKVFCGWWWLCKAG